MKRHKDTAHLNIKQHVCDKQFTQKINLEVHKKTIHLDLKQYSCDLCDKQYIKKGDLNRHTHQIHFKNIDLKSKYTCNPRLYSVSY